MKTIKIPELGIEVEKNVSQKGTSFKDLKMKKSWRLLNINEVIWLVNSEYAKKLKIFSGNDNFFFKQPFTYNNKRGFCAWLDAYSNLAVLVCSWLPERSYSSLGVRFCRSLK